MKRRVLAGMMLLLLIVAAFAPTAFAVEAPVQEDSVSEDTGDMSAREAQLTEDSGEPSGDTGADPEPEPTPTEEPEPTTEPTAEPTPTPQPVSGPTLHVVGDSTFYVNQETPAIDIMWDGGIPDNVSGYVWSYGVAGGSMSMFNISYDAKRLELAAGALNGHITEPGSYVVRCQPVNADQESATPGAETKLYVAASSNVLTITSSREFPVPVGSSVELIPSVGDNEADVEHYEWKPSGSNPGEASCRVYSAAAGATRYTCTAVMKNGERITGTILVTGTELVGSHSTVSLADGKAEPLRVSWSHGAPYEDLTYRWTVHGESGIDLGSYTGETLSLDALTALGPRTNPYTVTCQAYRNGKEVGRTASFSVRANGNPTRARAAAQPSGSAAASAEASASTVVGAVIENSPTGSATPAPTGPSPYTADSRMNIQWLWTLAIAATAVVCICVVMMHRHAAHRE